MDEDAMDEGPTPEGETWVNRFRIFISIDQMEVRLTPIATIDGDGIKTFEEAVEACKREGIEADLIDEGVIKTHLAEVNPTEFIIAHGLRPVHGTDGRIDFRVDMSAKPQFIADPKGDAIDYKNSMQVTLVNPGDVLAEIIQPTTGEAGVNVHGKPIEANPGIAARYFLGEGLEEKEGKIMVTAPGTPSMQDDVIMIRRNYIVPGDVDLSTGNINFPGTVIVQGNVTDGFEIISQENVVVNGLISGAKIKAKGYVKCAGGIQGKGQTEIIAGSFVAATFISSSTIYSDTDIVITKDALHSNLNCLGEIKLGGSLIGGVATAFNGVECGKNLGSENGVKTQVNIRTHYRQEKAREMANSVLPEVTVIFDRYKTFAKLEYLNEEEAKTLLQDITALQGLISKRQMFDGRAAKFDKLVYENKTARAKVLGTLEADATIASPYTKYTCMAPMRGPLSVNENNTSAKMAVAKGGY